MPACESADQTPQLVVLCRESFDDADLQVTRWQSYVIPIVASFTATRADAVLTVASKLDEIQVGDVTGDAVDDVVTLDVTSGSPALQVFPQLDTIEFDACSPNDD